MANLTINLDDEDKKGISEFCDCIGMTVSGLYNVFTKAVLLRWLCNVVSLFLQKEYTSTMIPFPL